MNLENNAALLCVRLIHNTNQLKLRRLRLNESKNEQHQIFDVKGYKRFHVKQGLVSDLIQFRLPYIVAWRQIKRLTDAGSKRDTSDH